MARAIDETLSILHGTKPKNPYRIKAREVAAREGFDGLDDMLEEYGMESIMPACCTEGCEVEPDGRCEHDCPSIMLALGLI